MHPTFSYQKQIVLWNVRQSARKKKWDYQVCAMHTLPHNLESMGQGFFLLMQPHMHNEWEDCIISLMRPGIKKKRIGALQAIYPSYLALTTWDHQLYTTNTLYFSSTLHLKAGIFWMKPLVQISGVFCPSFLLYQFLLVQVGKMDTYSLSTVFVFRGSWIHHRSRIHVVHINIRGYRKLFCSTWSCQQRVIVPPPKVIPHTW